MTKLSGIVIFNSNLLVSHSDALDLLANGGLLAVLLLVAGVWSVFSRVGQALRGQCSDLERALLHGLSAIVLGGFITASFNSPGLALPVGSLFWLSLGLLYALACSAAHRRAEERARAHAPHTRGAVTGAWR